MSISVRQKAHAEVRTVAERAEHKQSALGLALPHTAESIMIRFAQPNSGKLQLMSGLVFNVAVLGNDLESFDEAVTFERH